MLPLIEAEVEVPLFMNIIVCHQDIDWVGTDMVLGFEASEPDVDQEVGSTINAASYE